jgi:twinkle protein
MSGSVVAKISCPRCGSGDGLNIFEEDGVRTGYCFSSKHSDDCGSRYFHTEALAEIPESDVPYVEKEPQDLSWIESLHSLDNPDRGLMRGAYNYFGVKHGLSMQDGRTIAETYYPLRDDSNQVTGYKVRIHNPKKFYALGSVRKAMPFGWKEALEVGGYTLYITEGEEDAIAVYTGWMREKKQKVAVISLKQGAESVIKTIQPILKTITDKWKQVVYLPDYDEGAGEKATQDLRALFPATFPVKIAKYSEKDANDLIKAGKEKELVSSCYNAGVPLSQGVLQPDSEMFDLIKKAPEFGKSYPWEKLTRLTRGQRKGEVVYWGAAPKMGKSSIVNQLASWNVLHHGERILLVKPEEQPLATLRRFAGSLVGKVFHDPEVPVNPADVDKAMELMGDKVHIFDKWQTPKWPDTRQLIREEVLAQGVETVFLDPLTNFTVGMSGSERNDFLISMTRELSEDAANYGFTAHVFCHFNKAPKGDKQWNEGRVPTSDDFQGSSSMAQACHMMIGIQGWKLTDGEDRDFFNSQRVLHILEEREYGVSDRVETVWYGSQGRLLQKEGDE